MALYLVFIGLYVLGIYWCHEVICRLRQDIQEIRELRQISRTGVIIFIWFVTAIIATVLIWYGLAIIKGITASLRSIL